MIKYPNAYMEYLTYYHKQRDYFECHEVLEEYWKENPESPLSVTWVTLIQLAVAMYHERRGNLKGAVKMLTSAVKLLNIDDLERLGIQASQLKILMKERLIKLGENTQMAFEDINIPFRDQALEALITAIRIDDVVTDPFIINKHTLRDRSDVIRTRQDELTKRNA
jgi:predicted metal-dependent hydrolase